MGWHRRLCRRTPNQQEKLKLSNAEGTNYEQGTEWIRCFQYLAKLHELSESPESRKPPNLWYTDYHTVSIEASKVNKAVKYAHPSDTYNDKNFLCTAEYTKTERVGAKKAYRILYRGKVFCTPLVTSLVTSVGCAGGAWWKS